MRKSFLAAAVFALASATAMAQNATTQNDTTKTNPPTTMTNPPSTMTTTSEKPNQVMPSGIPNFINVKNDDMLSSNVVGLDIYNDQNNDIGKIQDIVFNNSKQMTGYILSVGGFRGMGKHYIAVDPGSVKVTYDASNKVWRGTMNATKDELKSAPEFKYEGQWNASRS
jgi:sporulation protein YlmC with PRC-barrel domain